MAAKQQGIDRVLVPEQNRRQVAKLEPDVTDGMTIQYVSNMDEVTKLAFAEE
ncbi:MAG: S16 family serine protease [Clostridia bacterium]